MTATILSIALAAALRVGDKAPDFTLPDTDGNPVTLSKLLEKGPVIVFFFPKAFTPGCTKQAGNFAQEQARLDQLGAQVVGISVDDVETLRRFKQDRGARYPLLSDADKKVVPLYSGLVPVLGYANRANFVVGRDGRVISVTEGSAAVDPTEAITSCRARTTQ